MTHHDATLACPVLFERCAIRSSWPEGHAARPSRLASSLHGWMASRAPLLMDSQGDPLAIIPPLGRPSASTKAPD